MAKPGGFISGSFGLLVLLALAMGVISHARAQSEPAGPGGDFVRFVQGKEYQAAVIGKAKDQWQGFGDRCTKVRFSVPDLLVPFSPIKMGPEGKPIEGAWVQPVEATVCGKPFHLSVFVSIGSPGQPLRYTALVPGDTKADPLLAVDAFKIAVINVPGFRDCDAMPQIVNSVFEGYTGGVVPDALHAGQRPWRESWIFRNCKGLFSVKVGFQPNKGGTAFIIYPAETSKLE